MLMRNNGPDKNGQWSFTDVAQSAGVNRLVQSNAQPEGSGSSWGDYDLDGDLDLVVCAYFSGMAGNRLFRNDGPDINGIWRFTDATAEAGIQETGVPGFIPSFIDMNNDLYPELIIIGDSGNSRYFINNHDGTFTDETSSARGIRSANAMGIDIADINNDQRLDFFVSNIRWDFPAAGGNILLIQNEDYSYNDHAYLSGCYDGHWGWGALINDFDLDGDKDILETNGFYYSGFSGNPVTLFLNDGDTLSFVESAVQCGINHNGQGRALIRIDPDNDGDIDALIFNYIEPTAYYQNEVINTKSINTDTHWSRIKLDTYARDSLAPQGIGSLITVSTPENDYILPIHSNPTYCGSSPVEAHIGLASESTIDSIQVAWPDGSFTTWTDMPVDQIHTLVASSHPADLDYSGAVNFDDVSEFLNRFVARDLSADHNGDTELDFVDFSRFVSDFLSAKKP
jgi:hypothetical protein